MILRDLPPVRLFWITAAVLTFGGGLACDDGPFDGRAFTLIGCESGLTIELEGTVDPTYTLTVSTDGQDVRFVSCSAADPCSLFFRDFTPSEVTVTYESGDRIVEETFTPEYLRSQPNGESCPPVCFNATVVLELGA